MSKKRVAFITYRIMDAKNRNAFQKPYRLCKKYKTDIFAVERIGDPCGIDDRANSINILKGYKIVYPIIFPIWAIYRVLKSQGGQIQNLYGLALYITSNGIHFECIRCDLGGRCLG